MINLVVKTITHKDINVILRLDFESGKVAIIDVDGDVKEYGFANRDLSFMPKWLDVLEALTIAVKEAKKDLEANLAERSKFKNTKCAHIARKPKLKPKQRLGSRGR